MQWQASALMTGLTFLNGRWMNVKTIHLFLKFAGWLFLITAVAKLYGATGNARIYQALDPIFATSFRALFMVVGAIEFSVGLICILSSRTLIATGLVAWLATNLLAYRLVLILIGYHKPCSCLGNLTDALHIPPQTADTAMKIILAYLLLGSYATLFWLWRQKRRLGDGS